VYRFLHPNLIFRPATPGSVSPLDIAGGFKPMKRFTFMTMMVTGLAVTGLTAQEIKERKENQQDRIAQGVKSGQLTAGETVKLETKEAKLNKEIRHDRKQNGGNLTNKEKKQINRQQNKLSKQIYKDKHNARHQ
jgi:hypothetical protein